MLQKVEISGVNFPRLYMAENDADVELARSNGIPYVKWRWGMEELMKLLLRPTLERMFPGINWNEVLGRRRRFSSDIIICHGNIDDEIHEATIVDNDLMLLSQLHHDEDELEFAEDESMMYEREVPVAESRRDICGSAGMGIGDFNEEHLSIEDYIGDLSSSVDIEVLQKLSLLPQFVGDIADCIKANYSQQMRWTEGYTKKLGVPLGNFKNTGVLPNLLIIDVSASIPDGVAATMLTLADTLRSNLNAELIITSARSGYYPIGSVLPKPQTLRRYYGRSNESSEFMGILAKHIAGREFGHVICFGDYDSPSDVSNHVIDGKPIDMTNTRVHELHYYHTAKYLWSGSDQWTGYGRWVEECCPGVTKHFDTSWCNVMKKNYTM